VLLNDVTCLEAARARAARMLHAKADRIAHGFRLATSRAPQREETEALQSYCEEQLASFRKRPEAARAAWTMTASLLLNLDELITQH
jgi:hypothetical protein